MDETTVAVCLILWRLVVATFASVIGAVALAVAIPAFSPVLGFALVILGVALGIVWQSKATFPSASVEPPISSPVAFLGLAFVGVVWGGLLELATGSSVAAAALLAATPTLSSPVIVLITKRALPARQLAFATIAFTAGFAVIYVIHRFATGAGA
jgi:hypothetical protein